MIMEVDAGAVEALAAELELDWPDALVAARNALTAGYVSPEQAREREHAAYEKGHDAYAHNVKVMGGYINEPLRINPFRFNLSEDDS